MDPLRPPEPPPLGTTIPRPGPLDPEIDGDAGEAGDVPNAQFTDRANNEEDLEEAVAQLEAARDAAAYVDLRTAELQRDLGQLQSEADNEGERARSAENAGDAGAPTQQTFDGDGSLLEEHVQDVSHAVPGEIDPDDPASELREGLRKTEDSDASADIEAMEDRIEAERDAAAMNFGFSVAAANATFGIAAGAGGGVGAAAVADSDDMVDQERLKAIEEAIERTKAATEKLQQVREAVAATRDEITDFVGSDPGGIRAPALSDATRLEEEYDPVLMQRVTGTTGDEYRDAASALHEVLATELASVGVDIDPDHLAAITDAIGSDRGDDSPEIPSGGSRLEEAYDPALMQRVTGTASEDPSLSPHASRDDAEATGTYQAARVPSTDGVSGRIGEDADDDGIETSVGGGGLLAGMVGDGMDPEPVARKLEIDLPDLEARIDPGLLDQLGLPATRRDADDSGSTTDPVVDEAEDGAPAAEEVGIPAGDEDVETEPPPGEPPRSDQEVGIPTGDEDAEGPFEEPRNWSDSGAEHAAAPATGGGGAPGQGQGNEEPSNGDDRDHGGGPGWRETNGGPHPGDEHRPDHAGGDLGAGGGGREDETDEDDSFDEGQGAG